MREFDNDVSWKKSFDSMFSAIKMRDCTPETVLETIARMEHISNPLSSGNRYCSTVKEYRSERCECFGVPPGALQERQDSAPGSRRQAFLHLSKHVTNNP